jgi:hypothetical protein
MDAAGLGLLVELSNWASAKRTQLKLLNLSPRVANLLNSTRLTPIFDVCTVWDVIDFLFQANPSSLATGYAGQEAVANVSVQQPEGFE